MKKTIVLIIVLLASLFLTKASMAIEAPVLLFSDLTSGPKTGWEGSSTKGAAVTIWGKNFGSTRGTSYITINGVQVTEYAEWGTIGTANGIPRGLERTTFWIPSTAQDGAGQITLTVNSVTSNSLPFTVRAGNIYFISINDGKDIYNGKYATYQGGNNGPWRKMKMALNHNNNVVQPGDTMYIRAGIYTEPDQDGAFMRGRGDYGVAGKPIAVVGYPAEMPVMEFAGISGSKRGVFSTEMGTYDGGITGINLGHGADYFTFAKLKVMHGTDAFDLWGVGNRIIGNWMKDNNDNSWSGVIMVDTSQDVRIYGNYFDHNGYDAFKHNIYIKTHDRSSIGTIIEAKDVHVGWNEFDRWTAALNPSESSRGGAVEIQQESPSSTGRYTRNVYIHDNYFHDGDSQAIYGGGKSINIYNNIFANIPSRTHAFQFDTLDSSSFVYNNIFYKIGSSNSPMMFFNVAVSAQWKNNIFVAYPGQRYVTAESPTSFNSDHDLFYGNGAPSGSNYNMANSIVADPLFVNPSAGDFHLQSSSPAKDAGSSAVASIVTKDHDFNPRPMGSGYDIGAYEYVSGSATYPKGDVNQDTNVNSIDIQLAVNIILGLENNQQFVKNADLNNDGDVNAIDLQLIVNIVLGV